MRKQGASAEIPLHYRRENQRTGFTRTGGHIPFLLSPDCLADLKIVLVEDHDDARRYLDLFLSDLGAKVVVARNGHEGLKAVKDSSPDLVLSDIKMPGMDELELLDEIRALGSDAANSVPVIAMSAYFSRTDGDRINEHIFGHACRSHSLQIN